jgi:hypothetical protein
MKKMKRFANGLTLHELISYEMGRLERLEKPTKWEQYRLAKAKQIISNERDDGRWGKLFELLFVGETSHKSGIAKQGKIDGYFWLNGKRHKVEYKTNGGRIGPLFRMVKPDTEYIIYIMDFTTRTYTNKDGSIGGGKHYTSVACIFTVADFLKLVDHLNATKVLTKDGIKEPAVQGDSAKLCKALWDYPLEFNPDNRYTTDDFEGIELW